MDDHNNLSVGRNGKRMQLPKDNGIRDQYPKGRENEISRFKGLSDSMNRTDIIAFRTELISSLEILL